MVMWPELTFPPINLWNAPRLVVQPEIKQAPKPKPVKCRTVSPVDTIRKLMEAR
jgi:hypothetical protein